MEVVSNQMELANTYAGLNEEDNLALEPIPVQPDRVISSNVGQSGGKNKSKNKPPYRVRFFNSNLSG